MSGVRHSALYQGEVRHRRFAPRAHAFEYRIGLLYLDLDEQDAVLGLSPLAGRARLAPFAFRERAKLYLETAKDNALAVRQAEEIKARDQLIADMKARLEKLEAAEQAKKEPQREASQSQRDTLHLKKG